MIGIEMMITVHWEKSLAEATKIPSSTAIPSAIFRRRAYSHRPCSERGSARVSA